MYDLRQRSLFAALRSLAIGRPVTSLLAGTAALAAVALATLLYQRTGAG